jgi:hypothetical protein
LEFPGISANFLEFSGILKIFSNGWVFRIFENFLRILKNYQELQEFWLIFRDMRIILGISEILGIF